MSNLWLLFSPYTIHNIITSHASCNTTRTVAVPFATAAAMPARTAATIGAGISTDICVVLQEDGHYYSDN